MAINNKSLLDSVGLEEYDKLIKGHIATKIAEQVAAAVKTYVIASYTSIFYKTDTGEHVAYNEPITSSTGIYKIVTIDNIVIEWNLLNVGDIILVKAHDQPDYWVTSVSDNTNNPVASIDILETQKIDLTPYMKKADAYTKTEVDGLVGDKANAEDVNNSIANLNALITNNTTRITTLENNEKTYDKNNDVLTVTEVTQIFNRH